MIIALDVDGVLRDFNGSLDRVYRKWNPTHGPSIEPYEWDLSASYPECVDINKFAFVEHAKEIFSEAEPYPGAVHFANRLYRDHNVVITTMQFEAMRPVLLDWLQRHRIPYHSLMFTREKYLVDADVLIDDNPEFLMDWVRETGKPAIQMLRSWNAVLNNAKYIRCLTYQDIIMALYEIKINMEDRCETL